MFCLDTEGHEELTMQRHQCTNFAGGSSVLQWQIHIETRRFLKSVAEACSARVRHAASLWVWPPS